MSWYHRQFRDTARERYFKNMNMALYFHSSIADYYLGIENIYNYTLNKFLYIFSLY